MPRVTSKPRFARREPNFPSVERVLEEAPTSPRFGGEYDLRPSHVFRHPYPRRTEDPDDEIEEVVLYGIRSSFLIPTWVLEEEAEPGVFDEVHRADTPISAGGGRQRRSMLKVALTVASTFALKIRNVFAKKN